MHDYKISVRKFIKKVFKDFTEKSALNIFFIIYFAFISLCFANLLCPIVTNKAIKIAEFDNSIAGKRFNSIEKSPTQKYSSYDEEGHNIRTC